jgi:hypothetical protein
MFLSAWKWMWLAKAKAKKKPLANLKEALELHLQPPQATRPPKVRTIEVEVGAA